MPRPPLNRICVDCANPTGRGPNTWRCYGCYRQLLAVQIKARHVITMAQRRGLLAPAKTLVCVDCGAPAHDHDHRDYSKPLDVAPVCRPCNQKRGPAKWGPSTLAAIQACRAELITQPKAA